MQPPLDAPGSAGAVAEMYDPDIISTQSCGWVSCSCLAEFLRGARNLVAATVAA